MRILLSCINFPPELTSTGRYAGETAFHLAKNGFDVSVITAPPYYPQWRVGDGYSAWNYRSEIIQEVEVSRCPLWVPERPSNLNRLPHLLSFALSTSPVFILRALLQKPDVVLCVIPTILSAPFALLAARLSGAKAWLHIQDFELDAAFGLGMLPGLKFIYPLAQKLEMFLLTRFDRVSTISESMRALCIQKGVWPERTFLLPNWVDTQALFPIQGVNSLREELHLCNDQAVILYHGNIGRKQGLEILLDCAERLSEKKEIVFVLCGDGAARHELELRAKGMTNVRFMGIQPEVRLNELVNLADIHVLPQLAGAADLVMPSKLTGMLASGKPVVASAEPHTQLGKVIGECGCIVPPGDVVELTKTILELVGDEQKRSMLGAAGRAYAEAHMDRRGILRQLVSELERLVN